MPMVERRFNQIRAQLELYERIDIDATDIGPLREMFNDSRRLLGEMVRSAEMGGMQGLFTGAGNLTLAQTIPWLVIAVGAALWFGGRLHG